jgi:uncharacterized membrane protein YidH (DUF202 family)
MNNEVVKKQLGAQSNPRVQLAFERTFLAYERTRIAWVGTALALISFGSHKWSFSTCGRNKVKQAR